VKDTLCTIDAHHAKIWFHGTCSYAKRLSRLLEPLWLIKADPHRGGSISLKPLEWTDTRRGLEKEKLIESARITVERARRLTAIMPVAVA
jgi:hypothetical protein